MGNAERPTATRIMQTLCALADAQFGELSDYIDEHVPVLTEAIEQ